mgnify:CR=1 FL=1
MMKKILVPIDGSDISLRAMNFAIELGKHFASEIVVLNVDIPYDLSRIKPAVKDKDGNEIDMRQNFDDEETGFDMRDVAGSETVTNENELLNDYTIKDADAGFDDPSVLEDDNSGSAAPASDEVDF